MTTVAIACTTGVYALLFSGQSNREGTRGKVGVARIECANTQRQKPSEEEGDDEERPLAAFHDLERRLRLSLKCSLADQGGGKRQGSFVLLRDKIERSRSQCSDEKTKYDNDYGFVDGAQLSGRYPPPILFAVRSIGLGHQAQSVRLTKFFGQRRHLGMQ